MLAPRETEATCDAKGAGAPQTREDGPLRGVCSRRRRKQEHVREEATLRSPEGEVDVLVLRPPGAGPFPAAVVGAACYRSMVPELAKAEGAFFVEHGYAYVLSSQRGPPEEIADAVFRRFQADAGAVLDWLGAQPWFDGRLGTHGVSLVGNMAFATVSAACAPGAPAGRPGVRAAACTVSFSRIWPTLFLWGDGFAAELAARFLYLAEQKLGSPERRRPQDLWRLGCFFAPREWPGLWSLSLRRPFTAVDEALWGRRNALWQAGARQRSADDSFWRDGVDVQCDLGALGERCPPLGIVTGWFDVFVRQAFDDFRAAQAEALGRAQLTVCSGGHFAVAHRYGKLAAHETLALYDEQVRGVDRATARSRLGLPERRAVRLELTGAPAGQRWLECDAWPPEPAGTMGCFLCAGAGGQGQLCFAEAPGEGTLEYVYDPADPTPYEGGSWLNLRKEGQQDQSRIESRSDVLVCSTPELEEPVDVVGEVRATLFVSSSAAECDFLVRLCAVPAAPRRRALPWSRAPEGGAGSSLSVVEGVSRVRFEGASPGACKEVRRVEVNLGPIAYRFNRGERIRIHICSAAHPRVLRHPLSDDDWLAGGGPLGAPARQAVHFGGGRPAALWLPLRGPGVTAAARLSRFEDPAAGANAEEPVGAPLPGASSWR